MRIKNQVRNGKNRYYLYQLPPSLDGEYMGIVSFSPSKDGGN
jgi:hypothetical protein